MLGWSHWSQDADDGHKHRPLLSRQNTLILSSDSDNQTQLYLREETVKLIELNSYSFELQSPLSAAKISLEF